MDRKKVIHLDTIFLAYFHRSLKEYTFYILGVNQEPEAVTGAFKSYTWINPDILYIPEGYCKEVLTPYMEANETRFILSEKKLPVEYLGLSLVLGPKPEGCAPENPYFIYK